jgi:beta-galactosidase
MSEAITRRTFLHRAAIAGTASALGFDRSSQGRATVASALPQRKASFDEQWSFSTGDFPEAYSPSYSSESWSRVDLPHDWSIAGPFAKDELSGGAGGYAPTGIGWYRKSFHLPKAVAQRRINILFDGVYQRSDMWINGQHLGMRPYGYISFSYDLTPYLHFGEQPNVIAVRVDNSLQPNSRWYSGSGIYRHVWLVITDPLHFAQWGTVIRTPEINSERALVEVTTRVRNERSDAAHCALTSAILDASGKTVHTDTALASIPAGSEYQFRQSLAVSAPLRWSLATPQLYSARQSLLVGESEIDATTTQFGIREARFDLDKGFLLNEERIKLNGVCLHCDGGAVGAAVPERIWQRRLALLKAMGCNAIRCSHNPPAPEFLDLCDTMGILVMDEAFDEWREPKGQTPQFGYHKYFDEWSARDITSMVQRDRNHPSIVIWSAGNEVPDQLVPRGPDTLRALRDILHAEDPTRPVTVACDHFASEPEAILPEFAALLDVAGYNYVDRWRDRREKYYSIDRHDYPQRRFIGTESVALGGPRGVYTIGATNPVFGQYPSNMRIEVEQLQKFIQTYDYVSGDFIWTGIDYLGEARWPAKSSASGVIDTCGFPKDGYYFYQSLWTDTPVLHLFPHWNWKGREGEVIPVACFTNCDTVELFLDGKSIGVKGFSFPRMGMAGNYGNYPPRAKVLQTTADLHLSWDVPFQPGTLKAVGVKDGQVIKTVEISTTGDPVAIRLAADRTLIETSPRDLSHITVQVVDAQGLPVPTADNTINFTLAGPGRILGVDNGRPDSHESYQGSQRRLFNGIALALLQSNGHPGTMRLTASSPALTGAEISVDCAAVLPR